jgi:transposase InsO family protein
MGVSRSGYYDWLNHPESNRDKENEKLTQMIKEISISRHRIGKLMAAANLQCKTKRKFKVTNDSRHNKPVSPNLLNRQFDLAPVEFEKVNRKSLKLA